MTGLSLYDEVTQGRRRRLLSIVAVVVLVVAGGVGAWWLLRPVPEDPRIAAEALASAWSDGELSGATFAGPPADLEEQYTAFVEGLQVEPPSVEVVEVADPGSDDDPLATRARLRVRWQLAEGQAWGYETTARLVRAPEELTWGVVWGPSLVHPDLTDGLALRQRRTTPSRAEVLAADGTPLVRTREVVDVGIQPSRVDDLDALLAALGEELATALDVDLDRDGLRDRVRSAGPDAFVSVITLRENDYLRVRDVVQPLPGTVFGRRQTPLAPTAGFARFTLGSSGPVTAEMIEEQPDRYRAGDVAGRSGLQAAYDERLFGTPGVEVALVGEQVPDDPVVFEAEPAPGQPVTITLDERVQRAADAAVEGTGFATGLAVLRPSDGHVLALANSTEAGFDVARTGQVPPGSTFKVITTAALLAETDLTPRTPIDCPGQVEVGGRTITNAESQQLGRVPFRTAFVNSCNTAFVQLSQDLSSTSLRDAADQFGIGRDLALGLDGFAGQVPETGDAVDLAATAIGQGRILVSPLAMAGAIATVANGAYPGLSLVLEPDPEGDPRSPDPLSDRQERLLQELTRGVVTEGTGTALADVPGGPVHGKTGTAEFQGPDGQLRTHAWFMGFQGDLAVAVAVTDTPGEYGGAVAAPVARRLLTALAGEG